VELGLTIHLTDRSIDVRDLAVEAEARGFSSLWLPEHTHIPASRRTPIPMGGVDLADEYPRSPDPYVSLAAAAALTDQIRLGTGVALVAQHHPINLAKAVASVDALSNGRFVLGIGYGWNVEEMAHHGVEFRTRRAQAREHVLAMRELWTGEAGEYHGDFVDFSPSWAWPKPVRNGGPPVYIGGGAGPKMFAAVAEFAEDLLVELRVPALKFPHGPQVREGIKLVVFRVLENANAHSWSPWVRALRSPGCCAPNARGWTRIVGQPCAGSQGGSACAQNAKEAAGPSRGLLGL